MVLKMSFSGLQKGGVDCRENSSIERYLKSFQGTVFKKFNFSILDNRYIQLKMHVCVHYSICYNFFFFYKRKILYTDCQSYYGALFSV